MIVEYWKDENDKVTPVVQFIQSVPTKAQAKILRGIDFLEQEGTSLLAVQNNLFRKMSGHQFYELRILYDKSCYRIFVVLYHPGAWLVHGIVKKSGKTPERDIRIVEERMYKLTHTRP